MVVIPQQQSTIAQGNETFATIEPAKASIAAINEPEFFPTITWQDWYEVEAQARSSIDDFLKAMEEGQPNSAIAAVMDLQQVAAKLLEEIYAKGVIEEAEAEESPSIPANLDTSV